jgi:protoheme IX farnesyltransferase
MLPVVHGERETHRQTFIYTVLLAVASLLLYATGDLGEIYLGAALVLGLAFVVQAWRLARGVILPMRLFFFSLIYLTTLFAAVALDVLVG